MSPTAAWYVTRILEEAPPPPNAIPPQHRKRGHAVAFKTGTSYGFRDAWAIGFDAAFTVGVWIGRPDGTFSPGRIGREAAAPVLYDIFDLLPPVPGANGVANPVRPAGVLVATNAALPAGLQRFEGRGSFANASLAADTPRISLSGRWRHAAALGRRRLSVAAAGSRRWKDAAALAGEWEARRFDAIPAESGMGARRRRGGANHRHRRHRPGRQRRDLD